MSDKYILKGHEPVPCRDLWEWAEWFERSRAECRVAWTKHGDVGVSTIFSTIDDGSDEGPPRLFETLVLNGPYDGERERHSTWEQAEEAHRRTCKKVFPTGLARVKRWFARVFLLSSGGL